jgi:hypothetical protein
MLLIGFAGLGFAGYGKSVSREVDLGLEERS